MIETPAAIYAAQGIAADPAVAGLIAGLNDLAYELKLPDGMDRGAMSHAIQTIVLAARAGGVWCFDGVYNAIDDAAGFAAEAREGRRLRSEEHTSELQSLMRTSYAVCCLKKKKEDDKSQHVSAVST